MTATQTKKPATLTIHPQPFKPSYLSIPSSPFTPRTPLPLSFPPYQYPQLAQKRCIYTPCSPTLPPSPLQWLWQCHQCRRTYAIAVTRRCLEDGHHFCAGTTTVKSWRKPVRARRVKKHKACASEFDYQGWKTWGRWRRSGRRDSVYDSDSSPSASSASLSSSSDSSLDDAVASKVLSASPATNKDCWNTCDYPSECRWGNRFGIHSPVVTSFPTTALPAVEPEDEQSPTSPTSSSVTEGVLRAEIYDDDDTRSSDIGLDASSPESATENPERSALWGALLASVTRRKSLTPSSPLAAVVEEEEGGTGTGSATAALSFDGIEHESTMGVGVGLDIAIEDTRESIETAPVDVPRTSAAAERRKGGYVSFAALSSEF